MLCSDLEDNERDKNALQKVLGTCLDELQMDQMVSDLNALPSMLMPPPPSPVKNNSFVLTRLFSASSTPHRTAAVLRNLEALLAALPATMPSLLSWTGLFIVFLKIKKSNAQGL